MAELASAGDRLVAELEETETDVTPTDVYATLLGALMDGYLNRYWAATDHPSFVPTAGFHQRLGSPNPDTIYRRAPIDASRLYRITGQRGTTADVTLMTFDATMRGGTPLDLDEVVDDDGAVDLLIGSQRPPGHGGHWWHIEPETTSVWVRSTSDRWGEEDEPRLAIVRADSTRSRTRLADEVLLGRLSDLAAAVEGVVGYGIRHVKELTDAGHVNSLAAIDYSARGGMPGQWYHEGVFDLGDQEALLVEMQLPAGWTYFSWSLTDPMLVTLDWVNAQTSINKSQATVDDDGVLRVAVCAVDPGIGNWMNTMGHGRGVLQCRTVGCEDPPIASARTVPVALLLDQLPTETRLVAPPERAEDLVERMRGYQLRSLW
jgi:hypothetical protein